MSPASGGRSSASAARTSKSRPAGVSSGPGTASCRCARGVRRRPAPRTPSAKRAQRLVAVLARAEVDLGHALEADRAQRVDQHRDLDAVADRERQLLEQRAAGGHLAGQRLAEAGQLGEVEVEQRAGHAARSRGRRSSGADLAADAEGPAEVGLDERELGSRQAAGRAAPRRSARRSPRCRRR